MKKKVYVASSWRNELRLMCHEVYDFKPPNGDAGMKTEYKHLGREY